MKRDNDDGGGLTPDQIPLAFSGSSLIALDDTAVGQIRRKRQSPSAASGIDKCPASFAAGRVVRESLGPFSATSLGTDTHTLLENLFGLPASSRTKDALVSLLADMSTSVEGVPDSEIERWTAEVLVRSVGIFKIENPADVDVYHREWRLDTVDVGGVPFHGIVDRTDRLPGGGLSVGDYKSSKKASYPAPWGDSHGDQIRLYVAAIAGVEGTTPMAGRVLYTKPGVGRDVSLSADDMADTLSRFASSWDKTQRFLDAKAWPTKRSKLCGWCPLVGCCPTAEGVASEIGLDRLVTLNTVSSGSGLVTVGQGSTTTTYRAQGKQTGDEIMYEGKPWQPTADDGSLNPASYSAIAAFSFTTMAVEQLSDHGILLTPKAVTATARTFATVVTQAQESMTGSSSFQNGANSRLRGALFATLKTLPAPFGGTAEDWDKWVARATRRCEAIFTAAVSVWSDLTERPWAALAVDEATGGVGSTAGAQTGE